VSFAFCQQLRDVVVIVSSPRGGSSLLAERLRSCPELIHLPGETPPLLALAGLDPLEQTGSDALGPEQAAKFASALDQQLELEVGNPVARVGVDKIADWLHRRLCMQWPDDQFESTEVKEYVRLAASKEPIPVDGTYFAAFTSFHLEFLAAVRAAHPAVNPYYYDLPEVLVAKFFPDLPVPAGPPSRRLIEVPPFLITRPWQAAAPENIEQRTLIMKAPGCSYQIPFYQALFPNARVRVLHLTRAPAAATHGLMAAWNHRGFFSREVPETLQIQGYTDCNPPWARSWWNFDLPADWRQMVAEPLGRVCAYQWHSAHRSVISATRDDRLDVLRLSHEDSIGEPRRRQAFTYRLGEWLNLSGRAIDALCEIAIAPVSATDMPDENRWITHQDKINKFIAEQPVREVAEELDYYPS
jgi:hypothetical protein